MSNYLSKYKRKDLSKYKNLTILFSILMFGSLFLGQAFREIFTYAYVVGWTFGIIFCILATITSIKAKAITKKKR